MPRGVSPASPPPVVRGDALSNSSKHAADLFAEELKPRLKELGFRKQSRNWWKNCSSSILTIAVEKCRWGTGQFDVHGGVYFSEFGNLDRPKYYQCHVQCHPKELKDREAADVETVEVGLVKKLESVSTMEGVTRLFKTGSQDTPFSIGDILVTNPVKKYLETRT